MNQEPIRGKLRGNVLWLATLLAALTIAPAWASVGKNDVGKKELKKGAVTAPKIAKRAVTTGKLDKQAVKAGKLADQAVTTAKLAEGAVTRPKIDDGAVDGSKVEGDSLGGAQINELALDFSVLQRRVAGACPAGQAIRKVNQAGEVACEVVQTTGSPTGPAGGELAGTYPNPVLAADAVTEVNIANNSVSSPKVLDNSLTAADIDESTLGFWSLSGNSGTSGSDFLGTTDDQPLNLRVNDARALRLEPASDGTNESPNVIGGTADNQVTDGVHSATISGGGRSNPADPATANRVTDNRGTVGGGGDNQAGNADASRNNAQSATVGGGQGNTAGGFRATVGGGLDNDATANGTTVAGGTFNTASGLEGTVGGGISNAVSEVGATVGGGRGNGASGTEATVGGGGSNEATGTGSTVSGGFGNATSALEATVSGGNGNTASGSDSTVAGGEANTASGAGAAVGGGIGNDNSGAGGTVSGGFNHSTTGLNPTIGGGDDNAAGGFYPTVGGGRSNLANGLTATVPGGDNNLASANHSFAAGRRAHADDTGAFVWGDSTNEDMASSADDQFIARASGRFFLQSDSTLDDQGGFINTSTGAFLSAGGAWTNASDENVKSGFEEVKPDEVLARVAELPVREWSYDAEPGVRHLGPTAQDFRAAFGLGADERHIASVDADGVALAAINGLERELRAERRQRAELERRVVRLEANLAALDREGS